jgi:hypothetical protein
MLRPLCLAFDDTPWKMTFRAGQSVADALAGRSSRDIVQTSGFVSPECLRKCRPWAFAGARFRLFDFRPSLVKLGDFAFAGSSLSRATLSDRLLPDVHSLQEILFGRQCASSRL